MPAPLTSIVEGWTQRLTFTLTSDGSAYNGTGITVSDLIITGRDGTAVDTTGDFGWVTASAGTVYYDPDAADFSASLSPYFVRVKLTDGSGKIAYFPNGEPAQLTVRPVWI
jgi:hypothetical protein